MSRRLPALVGLALFVAVAGIWVVPFFTRDRVFIAATPTLRPMDTALRTTEGSPVLLPAAARACLDQIEFGPSAQVVEIYVRRGQSDGPALALRGAAPGYRAVARVPGGYRPGPLRIPLAPAARETLGTLCLVNEGRHGVSFVANADPRELSLAVTRVNGHKIEPQLAVTLLEARHRSLLAHMGEVLQHVSAFRPGFIGPWLLWPLLVFTVIGVPLGVIAAVQLAVDADEGSDG